MAVNLEAGGLVEVILVGVGNRGEWMLRECTSEAGWRVAGVVDPVESHRQHACARLGLPESQAFASIEAALEAVGARAMILCTPTVTHVPFAKKGIDRGLAVLTEKGMAASWEEAVDLVRYVNERNGRLAVAQNYRYGGLAGLVREALNEPVPWNVGRPFHVDYLQHRVRPQPRTLTYPFASVWDMSCHHFDNLIDWFGPIESLTAHSFRAPWTAYEHDNNTAAFLRFRNGVTVHYLHSHDASRASFRLELQGEKGSLAFSDEQTAAFSERPVENFGRRPEVPVPVPAIAGERALLADFRAYLTTGREPGISARRNLETMALCEMTVRSIRERRTVRREELEVQP